MRIWAVDALLKNLQDYVVRDGDYRAKREDETYYQWWRAYSWDVLGDKEGR